MPPFLAPSPDSRMLIKIDEMDKLSKQIGGAQRGPCGID